VGSGSLALLERVACGATEAYLAGHGSIMGVLGQYGHCRHFE
jgi:hypothetical protein